MKVTPSLFPYLKGNLLEFGRDRFWLLSMLYVIKEIWACIHKDFYLN